MGSKEKIRNTNIEVLRILSILMIISFHYVYKSQYEYINLTSNTIFIKSFWFFGELGVNLFILITGYYLSNTKASFKKFVLLISEVLFYNFLLYIIGYVINRTPLDISLLFPIITGKYWFITAYLLIYILSPFYNVLISSMKKNTYQKFLLINLLIWCVIPTLFGLQYNTSESIMYYNRFIWLSYMYFVGAYIRIFKIKFLSNKKNTLLIIFITSILMISSIFVIYLFKDVFIRIGTSEIAYFWTPNNIFMFILSVSIFTFFTQITFKNNEIINKLASTTLGMYLLHDGHLVNYIWKKIFNSHINIYSNMFLFHILNATFSIFVIGAAIDLTRQLLEKKTMKKIVDSKVWPNIYSKIKLQTTNLIDKIL